MAPRRLGPMERVYRMLLETLERVGVDVSDADDTTAWHLARADDGAHARVVASWLVRTASAARNSSREWGVDR